MTWVKSWQTPFALLPHGRQRRRVRRRAAGKGELFVHRTVQRFQRLAQRAAAREIPPRPIAGILGGQDDFRRLEVIEDRRRGRGHDLARLIDAHLQRRVGARAIVSLDFHLARDDQRTVPVRQRKKLYRVAIVIGVRTDLRGGFDDQAAGFDRLRRQVGRGEPGLQVRFGGGVLVGVIRDVGDLKIHARSPSGKAVAAWKAAPGG